MFIRIGQHFCINTFHLGYKDLLRLDVPISELCRCISDNKRLRHFDAKASNVHDIVSFLASLLFFKRVSSRASERVTPRRRLQRLQALAECGGVLEARPHKAPSSCPRLNWCSQTAWLNVPAAAQNFPRSGQDGGDFRSGGPPGGVPGGLSSSWTCPGARAPRFP